MATDKLDSLLDTIDTELSDLEDFIEAQEPTIEDTASREDGDSVEFEEETLAIQDADGKAESAETAAGPEFEPSALDDAIDSTIDALTDAENELETMPSGEEATEDAGASAVPVTEEDAGAPDSDNVLAELLSTREVDASEVLETGDAQEEPETKARNDAQLFDDLFSEMETSVESDEDGAGSDEPPALELDLPEDLFGDQETATASVEDVSGDSESSIPGEELPDDPFEDLKLEDQAEENREIDLAESSFEAAAPDELAVLISKKMEALVTRLVEEQLPELADRIISEKLKKIISSME